LKTIDTLVEDIGKVLQGKSDFCTALSAKAFEEINGICVNRFSTEPKERNYLSMSGVGQECQRKLWYRVNPDGTPEPPSPALSLLFFYGDMIEELVLMLAKQAGHTVTGEQGEASIGGVKGHMDCIIDGMVVDVKSASPYAFKSKFHNNGLREDDPFGYISQLSSYVYASRNNPEVTEKTKGAFLVVNKVSGEICLDVYDFTEELKTKEKEIEDVKYMVAQPTPPDPLPTVPHGKSGNMALGFGCSMCDRKFKCFPNTRVFKSYKGPVYLAEVKKEPRMMEIK